MLRLISALILLTVFSTACANTKEEAAPVDVVVVEEVIEPEPAPAPVAAPPAEPVQMLPDTATQTPALAMMGFGAIAAGVLVGAVRRRL